MKVAVITGSNRGTGYTLARTLTEKGYQVVGLNRTLLGEPWQDEVQCDLRHLDQVEAAVAMTLSRYDLIDLLVHNATVRSLGPLASLSDQAWSDAVSVNIDAVFYLTRRYLPLLVRSQGTVVLMGSQVGVQLVEDAGAYSVTKTAVHALAGIMLREFRPHGVRSILVIPHAIANEEGDESSWKLERGIVADCIVKLVELPHSVTPSVVELRPTCPKRLDIRGLELLQYSL